MGDPGVAGRADRRKAQLEDRMEAAGARRDGRIGREKSFAEPALPCLWETPRPAGLAA